MGFNLECWRSLVDGMAGLLLIIYQGSQESGEVPADWELASVIPDHKKDMRKTQGTTNLLV